MKLEKLAYNIQRRIDILKYKQEQKFINNFVQLHGNSTEVPALKELYPARKTLANYLADDGLTVDVYASTKENKKKLTLKLTDLFGGKTAMRAVDADITKTHKYVKDDGITRVENDDNFLRHIYRQIVEMKNELKNIHR